MQNLDPELHVIYPVEYRVGYLLYPVEYILWVGLPSYDVKKNVVLWVTYWSS